MYLQVQESSFRLKKIVKVNQNKVGETGNFFFRNVKFFFFLIMRNLCEKWNFQRFSNFLRKSKKKTISRITSIRQFLGILKRGKMCCEWLLAASHYALIFLVQPIGFQIDLCYRNFGTGNETFRKLGP